MYLTHIHHHCPRQTIFILSNPYQKSNHKQHISLPISPPPTFIYFPITIQPPIPSALCLSHLLKQGSRHGKCLCHQSIMSHNHGNTGMSIHIISLRQSRKLLDICHNTVYMLFHCIESVLKVLFLVLLLGTLVVALACYVVLFCGTGVVVLENFVKEDIPNLVYRVKESRVDEMCK